MSERIQNKAMTRTQLEKHIIAHIIDKRCILLKDIKEVFKFIEENPKNPTREKSKDLNKKHSNDILNEVMAAFWKGAINLISLSDRLGWCKGSYTTTHIHTREGFRFLLIHESKFKKRRDKKSRDEINAENSSKGFIIEDGRLDDRENSAYAFFLRRKWLYYQKIIDNLDKQYIGIIHELCEKRKNHGNINDDDPLLCRLNLFIHLSTLAIEINDPAIIRIFENNLPKSYYEKIKDFFNPKNREYSQYITSRLTPINRDFIWEEYSRLQKICKGKSDAKIAKEICYLYPKRVPGLVNSHTRVLKIISEEKRRRPVKTDGWQRDGLTIID